MVLDRTCYRERFGDPATWSGDWRRPGRYLAGGQQQDVQEKLEVNKSMVIGMAIRGRQSSVIAAVLGVSRESVDRRLRPLGLKNLPGHVGRPPTANRKPIEIIRRCFVQLELRLVFN